MKIKLAATLIVTLSAYAGWAQKADNSAVNKRDKQAYEYTADKQGDSKTDVEITKKIRQALIEDDSLSTYAKNIKIITRGGEVTLKGPVRSSQEQNALLQKARDVAGVSGVNNQIDIVVK